MPGFVVLLAAFALLCTGRRRSAAGLEMQNPVAVERGSLVPVKSSAVSAVESTTAGEKSSAVPDVGSSGDGNKGAGRVGCPGRCRCEVDGLLRRVDCSDLGLREIPSNLSVFTSYL